MPLFPHKLSRLSIIKILVLCLLLGTVLFPKLSDRISAANVKLPVATPTLVAAANPQTTNNEAGTSVTWLSTGAFKEVSIAPIMFTNDIYEAAESDSRYDNKMGVYLTVSSITNEKFLNSTIDSLLADGSSSVTFDVKGNGVSFDSRAQIASELGLIKNKYDLSAVIQKLHAKNIYAIGRFVAVKDAEFTARKPDTRIKHHQTGRVLSAGWIDPANDEAIDFNMEVICELAASGIDEINLDYIRFSTSEFGALKVYSGQEKAERIEKFLRAARQTIDRCGSKTKLGISTYAILGWQYDANVATLGQDIVRFAPLVDVISPMAYPATFTGAGYYRPGIDPVSRMYYLVYRTLTGYAELLGPDQRHKLRPWIQGYYSTTNDMLDQIHAVYDAGLCGFQVWSAGNFYAATYAAIAKDIARPERCRKFKE